MVNTVKMTVNANLMVIPIKMTVNTVKMMVNANLMVIPIKMTVICKSNGNPYQNDGKSCQNRGNMQI